MKHKLLLITFLLFLSLLSLAPQGTQKIYAADPPNPQPCNNPVVTDNLTDNYITDDKGDPPGPSEIGTGNPEALKFTVTRTGQQGQLPTVPIRKQMTFKVNFSRLQALFGANNSNYAEGLFQDQNHARLNILGLPSGKLQTFQGALQKTTPKVMTDALRTNYVRYVYEKPEIAESGLKFSDYQNSAGSEKTVHQLVEEYGQPNPPKASDDKTVWNQQWGKYWEKIPTTYDEFYLGKLEFRAYLGQPTIEKLKDPDNPEEAQQACSNFTVLRTVEFPVPRFFRTAQTTGILNQMLLPKVAQSQENNLIDLTAGTGRVAGIKDEATGIFETCFQLATQNAVSKNIKKIFKISMQKTGPGQKALAQLIKSYVSNPAEQVLTGINRFSLKDLNPVKDVYAINKATNLRTNQSGCGPNGRVNATLSWTHADDPSGGLPLQDQELDISLSSNFSSTVTQTFSLSRLQESRTFSDFFQPNTDYFWRVRSQYFGVWSTNDNVASFHSITCAQPSCTISTSTAIPGQQITVRSQNGLFGTIGMQGAFGTIVYSGLGDLPANGSTTITVPNNALIGLYVVRVGAFGVACTPNLAVNAPAPSCSITAPATLYPGDRFTVNSINGLVGEIQIKGAFWPVDKPSVNIGYLNPPSTLTLPIPNDFDPGLYAVRVGGFAVYCGDVSIGQWQLQATPPYYGNDVKLQVTDGPVPHTSGGAHTLNIYNIVPGGSTAACFPQGSPIFTTTVNSQTVTWTPSSVQKGTFFAVISKGTDHVSNGVCFDVRFLLKRIGTGREVSFSISPPVHIDPSALSAVAIVITNTDTGTDIHDSGGLPKGTTTYPIPPADPLTLPAGNYRACLSNLALGVWDNDQLDPPKHACTEFPIEFTWPWVSAHLSDDSCIKVHPAGKAGNAPYCAVYNLKFDPQGSDPVNVRAGECRNQNDQYKLNDQPNVDCDFTFSIDSNIRLPVDSNGNGKIDPNELGSWDECDPIYNQTDPITCYITINVWPDFRIPFLSQAWNNTLYSDVSEVLPTLQQTGRPGFYTFAQPKVAQKFSSQDPLATQLQGWVDACLADPPTGNGDLSTSGCADLVNWATTGDVPSQYDGLAKCVMDNMITNQQAMVTCLTGVTQTIINQIIKLPGQINDSQQVQGINTGNGGQVLAENSAQKERFVGGVECGKHLTRDIMLKPKVLQQHLGVKFECDLTAQSEPTNPNTPPGGNPPPPFEPPADCNPLTDGNLANGIETGRDELVCQILREADGKFEKMTGLPLAPVMIQVMDAESGGRQCAVGLDDEVGIFQYIASTWKSTLVMDNIDSGSGNYEQYQGGKTVCWGVQGPEPNKFTGDSLRSWPINFGSPFDGEAWNPYLQIHKTAIMMELTGGCPWSTFRQQHPEISCSGF